MSSFVENFINIFYFNWLIFSIAISYMFDTKEGKETKDPKTNKYIEKIRIFLWLHDFRVTCP
jgi:hypothetical protein